MGTPTIVRHNKVELALHELRQGEGRSLLLLHGLGEHTPPDPPAFTARWAGPIVGLDFTGHGSSTVPRGGGYTSEVLMADADAALEHLGRSTVIGRGIGAYIALLIAGARPSLVRGAVLVDGPGLAGGSTGPASSVILPSPRLDSVPPDGWALLELAHDVRPPDYSTSFARLATQFSGLAWPLAVCARWRPPWLEAVAAEPGVLDTTLDEALAYYASV
jgi:pimeloyl-ACP methyl ester carboxylesterase